MWNFTSHKLYNQRHQLHNTRTLTPKLYVYEVDKKDGKHDSEITVRAKNIRRAIYQIGVELYLENSTYIDKNIREN